MQTSKFLFPWLALMFVFSVLANSYATVINVNVDDKNTSTVNADSSYIITYTTGGAGALAISEWIEIRFPDNTDVPGSVDSTNITVNGTNIPSSASGTGLVLQFDTPVVIDNGDPVEIIIAQAAGIDNPSIPGNYQLEVLTQSETTWVSSNNYTITADGTVLEVGDVAVNPNTIGYPAEYTIAMTLSTNGDLWVDKSVITIIFLPGTSVTDGPLAGVTVNLTGAVSASGNAGTRVITIVPSQTISGGAAVSVVIPPTALRNPFAAADYTLDVSTSTQPTAGTSGIYSIKASVTPLTVGTPTISPDTVGNIGQYEFDITTSADGALVAGTSTISVEFPPETSVPATYASGDIEIAGTAVSIASGSGQTVTFTTPIDLDADTTYSIRFTTDAELRNPFAADDYTLDVSTSVQTTPGTSGIYSIKASVTPLTIGTPTISPDTVGNIGQYEFDITTSADGALVAGTSTISVEFPPETSVPATYASGDIEIAGTAVSIASGSGQTVTFTTPINLDADTTYSIRFTTDAELRNPFAAADYTLDVSTSAQPTAGTSGIYSIKASVTPLTVGTPTISPDTVGNIGQYEFDITTSADGALVAGTSTISVEFPPETSVPATYASGDIEIAGTAVSIASGSGQTVTFTTPINLDADTTYSIRFTTDAELRNPFAAADYTLDVSTSPQPTAGTSGIYSIKASVTPLTVGTPTISPDTVGNIGQYEFDITTSADGALVAGTSTISVEFPPETSVPATYASGDIEIAGTAVSIASGSGQTVTFTTPINLDADTTYSIRFTTDAELRNPTIPGNYTLKVSTSVQPQETSPEYEIKISLTRVNVTTVTPSPNIVNTLAGYAINLTPAVLLRASISAIFLQFPLNAEVPDGSISNVAVGGAPGSATGDSATRVVSIVPSVDVPDGVGTTVMLSNAVITNPSRPNFSYSLGVSTTAQPLGTQTYTIQASTTQISNISVVPSPSRAGQVASYTVHFTTGANGRLGAGNIITVEFPAGTGLPASFSSGDILVNSIGNTGTVYPVNRVVNILVPPGVMVANHGAVTVLLPGISNPGVGFYRLDDVHTDAEPFPVPSPYYWITADSQITLGQVLVSPDVINANAQYTVNLILGAEGSLTQNIDKIFLSFPTSTSLPLIANPSNITVNGAVAAGAVMLSLHSIEILSPIDISASASNKSVQVVFQTSFGITNPPLPGAYTLSGYTTIENTPVTSEPYQINPSTNTYLTPPQVQLSPLFTNSYGRYDIQCQTGSLGGLVKDISTISLVFPDDFIIPANIGANQISINNQPLTTVVSITNHTLVLTTPVDIASAGSLQIIIESAAHIQNPAAPGDYSLSLYTSSEPTPMESNSLHIAKSTWKDVVSYPNPLKLPETRNKNFTFLFIPEQSATLRIYTLDGKLVRTLTKNDRTDRMVWNLNNEKGQQIASGIYIYKISGPGGEKKGKLAILK